MSCSFVVAEDNITSKSNYEDSLNQQEINIDEANCDYLNEKSNFEENNPIGGINIDSISENTYNSIEIYVGRNKTSDGGNGSYDNPYATLDLACQNVNGENKATVNIFNGTYYLGSLLKFNTSNLFINGINGNVIIKNEKDTTWDQQAFSLQSSSANFTMKNIIFNSSVTAVGGQFTSFIGNADYGTYINCTFKGTLYTSLYGGNEFNSEFINCIFTDFEDRNFFHCYRLEGSKFVYFENCIFLTPKLIYLNQYLSQDKNISMNGIWFGENKIGDYTRNLKVPLNNGWGRRDIPIIRYAIFSCHENYLGDNKYEIVGKLTWNGTDSSEGMENFQPMTVTLTSTTGEIQSTVNLINGSFKVNYTSNSLNNNVIAKLDYEKITLNFNTVTLQAEPLNIYYGDNQDIKIKFNKAISGLLNITANNKTYEKIEVINSDSFVYTIPDSLTEGKYPIHIVLYNNENNIHGLGSTELIVSKVKEYDFIPILPADAKVGENKISFELPDDATGNITIILDKNNFTMDILTSSEISIDGFIEGDNIINIFYSGDNKYVNKSIERIITAEKIEISLDDNLIFTPPSGNDVASFIVELPTGTNGNLTININGKNHTQGATDNNIIKLEDLPPGNYKAIINYSGDTKFHPSTTNYSFVISKPILTAQDVSIVYTSSNMYSVKVIRGGKAITGKIIIFNVNGKIQTAKTDSNGFASIKINLPPKSKAYPITASYLGVTVKNKITVKSIMVAKNLKVKKTSKKIKIKITLKKVDGKYLKGKKISLKFKGKTYNVKTNKKGVATFIIKNNVVKKLKVGKTYPYQVSYIKDTLSKKIIVKK